MKRVLFLLSLVLVTAWIAGVFAGKLSGMGHILLFLGILFYLRSMMIVEVPAASATKLESGDH